MSTRRPTHLSSHPFIFFLLLAYLIRGIVTSHGILIHMYCSASHPKHSTSSPFPPLRRIRCHIIYLLFSFPLCVSFPSTPGFHHTFPSPRRNESIPSAGNRQYNVNVQLTSLHIKSEQNLTRSQYAFPATKITPYSLKIGNSHHGRHKYSSHFILSCRSMSLRPRSS